MFHILMLDDFFSKCITNELNLNDQFYWKQVNQFESLSRNGKTMLEWNLKLQIVC